MSHIIAEAPVSAEGPVLARLSRLDRFLPVWIIAAMALGLVLGRVIPGLDDALDAVKVGSVSLPIAIGLLPRNSSVRLGRRSTRTRPSGTARPKSIGTLRRPSG